jgi:mannosyltransferase
LNRKIENLAATTSRQSWLPFGLLVLVTIFAAGLRFFRLGEWSFWIDEIYTINHAIIHFGSPELILEHIPPTRNWVPLSVILTAQMMNAWGVNEWSARFVSALIGVLTIPILYMPLKKTFGDPAALITMLLLAVAPWHIFWSQNARFYTSLMLFYSLALLTFYFAIERDRPLYFIVFYVLFYLAMSERMIALLLVPVIVVYLLLLWLLPFEKPAGFKVQNILILSAPIIAFLAYEVYLFAATGDFIFASDLDLLAPPVDTPIRLLIVIAFSIGLPILCLAFFSGIYLLMKKERAGLFFFIASVLPPLLIALANPFVFTVERYAFMTLLFWVALAAGGLKALFTLAGKQGTVLALGVLFILLADAAGSSLMYYQINHGNRLDWRESVEYVRERMEEGDVVVSTRAPLASYYLGENTLEFKDLLPADLEKIDAPIWFIMEYPGIWHGREGSMAWIEEHAQLLRYSYLRVMEANHMLIYRFDPTQTKNP